MDKASSSGPIGTTNRDPAAPLDPGRVAREMTDPLAVISTRIEVMLAEAEERSVPAAVVEDLVALDRNIKRLWVTLDVLRHANGAQLPGTRPVELNGLVRGPALLLEKLARAEGIEVTVDLDPGSPVILADPTALSEVVAGLLADARAAMSPGDRLRIETGPVRRHPERAGLTISTSGPGVVDWTATALTPGHRILLTHYCSTVAIRSDAASAALTLDFPRLAAAPRTPESRPAGGHHHGSRF